MGGWGSGEYPRARPSPRKVHEFRALDVRELRRDGHLPEDTAEFSVTYPWRGHPVTTRIPMDWRSAYLGGWRPCFECPECGQRAYVLYLAERCACRSCLGLAYRVCYESKTDQALRRARKARERLGAGGGLSDLILRPGGMHRRTYERLRQCADDAAARLYHVIGRQFPANPDFRD